MARLCSTLLLNQFRIYRSQVFQAVRNAHKLQSDQSKELSYVYGTSNLSLVNDTIPELFAESVKQNGQKLAVISMAQDLSKTYNDLDQDSNKLMAALIKANVGRGDRVALWSTSCYEWIVTQFAAAKLGCILVNVNPGYKEKELKFCLNLVEAKVLIAQQQFKSQNFVEVIRKAAPDLTKQEPGELHSKFIPSLKHIFYLDQKEDIGHAKFMRFSDLLNSNAIYEKTVQDAKLEQPKFGDVVNVQFTSGTTGQPKGTALSHFNLVNNVLLSSHRILDGLSTKTMCVPNPLYHIFGCVNGSLMGMLCAATVVLPGPVPVAKNTIKAISDHKCTLVYGTPTMFSDMVNCNQINDYDRSPLERAVMSGAPCPAKLAIRLRELYPNLRFVSLPYGSTETSPLMTIPEINENQTNDDLNNVGIPLQHVEIKLINDKGQTIPKGQSGEVCSRGHNVMVGYWNEPDKTKEAIDQDGWYHTGDIGVMDEKGQLSIVGRNKDMVIRGGENIFPREVEDYLIGHESIADVNVVGVPDDRLGEQLCACIIHKPNQPQLSRDDIHNYLKDKITHFKIPHYVIHVSEFPRTVTMKVQKFELRKIAMKQLDIKEIS